MVLIAQEQFDIHAKYSAEELKEIAAAPQKKVDYGLFLYEKRKNILIAGTKRKKGLSETVYTRLNQKSYKNQEWLDKMYKRRNKESHSELIKVILPLALPVGYKLYQTDGSYYGTVVRNEELESLMYILSKKSGSVGPGRNKPDKPFKWPLEKYYIYGADGDLDGLKVREEDIKGYERPG